MIGLPGLSRKSLAFGVVPAIRIRSRSSNSLRVSRTQVLHRGLCLPSVIFVHTHTGFVLHARAFPPLALYSTAVTMHVVPSAIVRVSPIKAPSVSYRTSCCVAGLPVPSLVGILGVRGLCVGVRAVGAVGELGDVVDLGIVLLRVRRNVGDCGLRVASPRSGDTGGLSWGTRR